MTDKSPISEKPSGNDIASCADLVASLRNFERRAISTAITELERNSDLAPGLLREMKPHLGHALIIGITGPPGAGKSTLVNALISNIRNSNRTVGVIAVDPSSPVSGGAILGDRIRMSAALDDDGVFVRSLASRGYLGGLSPAAVRIIDVFDAAHFDFIILETVGTGQNEIDVAEVADLRIVVVAPGLGDNIQAMKSGLLEIADILVVNKADRDGAENTMHQLIGALSLSASQGDPPPVLKTTATTSEGVTALFETIEKLGAKVLATPAQARRRSRARYLIARSAADLVASKVKSGAGGRLDALADDVLSGTITAQQAASKLLALSKD